MSSGTCKYHFVGTPLGEVVIVGGDEGICALEFIENGREQTLLQLRRSHSCKELLPGNDSEFREVEEYLDSLFSGSPGTSAERPRLSPRGTPFQMRVWKELSKLRPDETVSYSEIARRIGHPKATRAVGNAVGANPISLLIPCHLVIRSDGSLGNYRWGAERKRRLLELILKT